MLPGRCEGVSVECVGNNSGNNLSLTDSSNSSDQTKSSQSSTLSSSKSNASQKALHQAFKARLAAKAEKEENDTVYKQVLKEATVAGSVILKLDTGPGQMVVSKESIKKCKDFKEKGLCILLGLPNATAVQ